MICGARLANAAHLAKVLAQAEKDRQRSELTTLGHWCPAQNQYCPYPTVWLTANRDLSTVPRLPIGQVPLQQLRAKQPTIGLCRCPGRSSGGFRFCHAADWHCDTTDKILPVQYPTPTSIGAHRAVKTPCALLTRLRNHAPIAPQAPRVPSAWIYQRSPEDPAGTDRT
ncbi:hypothetical protein D3C84_440580 [compost metagenome]